MRKLLLQVFLPALGGVGLLLGVALIGQVARERLRSRDQAVVAFTDIDCPAPPGLARADFLDAVQMQASFPDQLPLRDDGLASRLGHAFALHPWVEKVEHVEIIPPRQVRVRLLYRTPVLAIPHAGQVRAVDRHGVLLPAEARTEGLPVFSGDANPPAGVVGTRWGDPAVEEAARQAGRPRAEVPH